MAEDRDRKTTQLEAEKKALQNRINEIEIAIDELYNKLYTQLERGPDFAKLGEAAESLYEVEESEISVKLNETVKVWVLHETDFVGGVN